MLSFEVLFEEGAARRGRIGTSRGAIETPAFVPVATLASIKNLSAEDLRETGTQTIIANAYHLHLQPGETLVEKMGGLNRFMGWDGPALTDSGGFQIFSLGAAKEHGVGKVASIFPEETRDPGQRPSRDRPLVRVSEEGATFLSHLDGSEQRFSPERVLEIQRKIGADIAFVLDECTSPLHPYAYTREAMKRTHRWAIRALEASPPAGRRQALMGIVQGGAFRDLRSESAAFFAGLDFEGYAIGGSLGKSKSDMHRVLEWTLPLLPADKPRHLLGIGEVEDIFEVVERGIDLFDCAAPTRLAGTGTLLARGRERFRIHLSNSEFRDDARPVDPWCRCCTCRNYSRAYLRHLFTVGDALAVRLAAIHNLSFVQSLMKQIRTAIKEGGFSRLKEAWLSPETARDRLTAAGPVRDKIPSDKGVPSIK